MAYNDYFGKLLFLICNFIVEILLIYILLFTWACLSKLIYSIFKRKKINEFFDKFKAEVNL